MIKKALSDECHKHNTKVEKTTNAEQGKKHKKVTRTQTKISSFCLVEKMTQYFFDPSQMKKKLNKNEGNLTTFYK